MIIFFFFLASSAHFFSLSKVLLIKKEDKNKKEILHLICYDNYIDVTDFKQWIQGFWKMNKISGNCSSVRSPVNGSFNAEHDYPEFSTFLWSTRLLLISRIYINNIDIDIDQKLRQKDAFTLSLSRDSFLLGSLFPLRFNLSLLCK